MKIFLGNNISIEGSMINAIFFYAKKQNEYNYFTYWLLGGILYLTARQEHKNKKEWLR